MPHTRRWIVAPASKISKSSTRKKKQREKEKKERSKYEDINAVWYECEGQHKSNKLLPFKKSRWSISFTITTTTNTTAEFTYHMSE
jgi:hypothetical protein